MPRPLILEWAPLWEVGSANEQGMFLFSVALFAYAIIGSQKRHYFEALALTMTAYLAMKHYRHGSLYAVVWICFVPGMLETSRMGRWVRSLWTAHSARIAGVSVAIGILALGCSIKLKFWELRVPTATTVPGLPAFPVGAVEFLKQQQFQGNIFVPFATGAFVTWKLYPACKVSIDSRYEVAYPDGAAEENHEFYRGGENWRETLNKYPTDIVLIPKDRALLQVFEQAVQQDSNFGWHRVFADEGNVVYARAGILKECRQPNLEARSFPEDVLR